MWLKYSFPLVAQILVPTWLKYSLTFTLTELSRRLDIALPNLSILKNGHAKAIRMALLDALCRELDCQPGELLVWEPDDAAEKE